jgi:hypothetical protein
VFEADICSKCVLLKKKMCLKQTFAQNVSCRSCLNEQLKDTGEEKKKLDKMCLLEVAWQPPRNLRWKQTFAEKASRTTTPHEMKCVFSSLKKLKKNIIARFDFIWQIVSNRWLIRFKTFISQSTTKLYN